MTDPKVLYSRFKASPQFQEALQAFKSSVHKQEIVLEDDIQNVFENSASAREAFISFSTTQHFKLDTSIYPSPLQEAIGTFLSASKLLAEAVASGNQRSIIEHESPKNSTQKTLADLLFLHDLAPNTNIGMGLTTLMSIDQGMLPPDQAREDTMRIVDK